MLASSSKALRKCCRFCRACDPMSMNSSGIDRRSPDGHGVGQRGPGRQQLTGNSRPEAMTFVRPLLVVAVRDRLIDV